MASSDDFLYSEGEKVLCYHGPLLYEAKCLKQRVSEEDATIEYLMHYQGWSKNWDEWVKESRILKYTDSNLATQKELLEQNNSARKKAKRKSTTTKDSKSNQDIKSEGSTHDPDSRSSTPSVDGKTKGKSGKVAKNMETTQPTTPVVHPAPHPDSTPVVDLIKTEEDEIGDATTDGTQPDTEPVFEEIYIPTKKIKKVPIVLLSDILFHKDPILSNPDNGTINIPKNLYNWLADDWYQITKVKKLVNIPAAITVVDILKDYKEYKLSTDPSMPALEIHRIATEIEEYFNGCLGAFLLFKCERPQYADIKETHPDTPVQSIYGSHHFLRLFSKSKQLFECLPESAVAPAAATFHDVINFLSKMESKYFSTENYGIAPPEYHRRNI